MGAATSERLRSGRHTRPLPLLIYVGGSLAAVLYSIVLYPDQITSPWIIPTLVSLLLVKMWDGSAGVWWFSVVTLGASAAYSVVTGSRGDMDWPNLAVCAVAFLLLVHPSTRRWFNERIAERFP